MFYISLYFYYLDDYLNNYVGFILLIGKLLITKIPKNNVRIFFR